MDGLDSSRRRGTSLLPLPLGREEVRESKAGTGRRREVAMTVVCGRERRWVVRARPMPRI